jgi:hypothetical protein
MSILYSEIVAHKINLNINCLLIYKKKKKKKNQTNFVSCDAPVVEERGAQCEDDE